MWKRGAFRKGQTNLQRNKSWNKPGCEQQKHKARALNCEVLAASLGWINQESGEGTGELRGLSGAGAAADLPPNYSLIGKANKELLAL